MNDTTPAPGDRPYDHLPDGIPCPHSGCLSHVNKPCDGCGRKAGRRISPSTPTPRTDALWAENRGSESLLNHARALEAELAEKSHVDRTNADLVVQCNHMEAETRRLREALEKGVGFLKKLYIDMDGEGDELGAKIVKAKYLELEALAAPTPDGGVRCTCDSVKAVPGGGVPMCPTCERESEDEKASGRLSFHGALRLLADIPDSTEMDRLKKAIYEKSSYMADDTLFPEIARRIREFAEKASAGAGDITDTQRLEWLMKRVRVMVDGHGTRAEIDAAMREGEP